MTNIANDDAPAGVEDLKALLAKAAPGATIEQAAAALRGNPRAPEILNAAAELAGRGYIAYGFPPADAALMLVAAALNTMEGKDSDEQPDFTPEPEVNAAMAALPEDADELLALIGLASSKLFHVAGLQAGLEMSLATLLQVALPADDEDGDNDGPSVA